MGLCLFLLHKIDVLLYFVSFDELTDVVPHPVKVQEEPAGAMLSCAIDTGCTNGLNSTVVDRISKPTSLTRKAGLKFS